MAMIVRLVLMSVTLLIATSSMAFAQPRHIVDVPTVAATMAEHANAQDANRAAVREALARPEVRDVASRMGIDLAQVEGRVQTLNGADLDRVAEWAREVNTSLVGGASTVVISTTAIIIALLIVIILVVAL
jgi:pyruvate/2-oxoglutarate dehydrogenase complex dihydrolipoamide acyltransferase (E2) component